MKKKIKAKIASSVNDIIFSEIDLKETTFNNNKDKDVVYYSLDIMSDNSSNSPKNSDNSGNNSPNSGSFNLDDYDLNIDDLSDNLNDDLNINDLSDKLSDNLDIKNISIKDSSDLSLNNIKNVEDLNVNKLKTIHDIDNLDNLDNLDDIDNLDNINNKNPTETDITYKKCEETKTKLNTSEFFKILNQNKNTSTIENELQTNLFKTSQNHNNKNIEEEKNNQNIEDEQNNQNIEEEQNNQNIEEEQNNGNIEEEQNNGNVEEEQNNGNIEEEQNNRNIEENKKSIEDLHNMNTQEKITIWKDLIDTNINAHSSYNYLQTETQNNNLANLINKDRLFKFYKLAEKNKKNIYGYIDNNKIYNCEPSKTYEYEVHTKLTNENIDPPGNYINIFMKKDLDKIKCVYLLNNNGYWTMEPLENFQSFKNDEIKQKILLIYFIILKILFCNKHYPFNDGNSIQKYRNLTKNINLNIINHINNNINFKNYINTQFKNVFKINDTIEDIIKLINDNNINKYYGRILKLKYKYY